MTQIEQIKAEIERLTEVTGYALSEYENGRRSAMYDIRKQLTEYINSLPAEQQSEELEKAAKEYVKENCILPEDCNDGDNQYYEECTAAVFKDGANWQKEQMMKNAVETKVKGFVNGKGIYIDTDIPIGIDVNEGDKVKIIIIKEDEQ